MSFLAKQLITRPTITTRTLSAHGIRAYSIPAPAHKNTVNIVEVGPRDGLQNEKGSVIPADVKVELIERLIEAGATSVEAGSFVSPKWVPQMAGTADVLKSINPKHRTNIHLPVLVPNKKGLDDLFKLLDEHPGVTDEIAVFAAATESFSKANLNCSIAESLAKMSEVTRLATERGLRVRGYTSVVVWCPYEGRTNASKVREVTKELLDMGCYEVSLGETVGRGRPHEVLEMLEEVAKAVDPGKLAGHFHDTYGTGVANMLAALNFGLRTFDSSVGGLGGCPYSPGATGNVATEDLLYTLQDSPYHVAGASTTSKSGGIDLEKVSDIGWWISQKLGRESVSRVGRAIKARKSREEALKSKL
ncbi:hypothetical protein CVT24_000144 [Panaeolus cyanescens]|uniref:hydroxymethylglutaryl-CoA lyase n=1 Tax=Panaeolus cyanescens TaxID=181874 RepID=A0A409WBT8_9AGAR|nr:hypothetical protein CVT24_000144 [Panaeolus cyanescens]